MVTQEQKASLLNGITFKTSPNGGVDVTADLKYFVKLGRQNGVHVTVRPSYPRRAYLTKENTDMTSFCVARPLTADGALGRPAGELDLVELWAVGLGVVLQGQCRRLTLSPRLSPFLSLPHTLPVVRS